MPTFCMLVSSMSLVASLGLIAYDGWSVGILVIGLLVVLVMFLQFIVYGVHQFVASALQIWRAVISLTVNAVRGFRGLVGGG